MSIEILHSDVIPVGWDILVKHCRWGSFYHSSCNLKLIKALTPGRMFFIYCMENGKISGGIAYTVHEGPSGKVINSLPYFGSYGDAVLLPETSAETEAALYNALIAECKKLDALCLTVITSPFADDEHFNAVKKALNPTFTDERLCQITNIPEYCGESRAEYFDKLMNVFEGRARTAYRKASKCGFAMKHCETDAETLAFASIHKDNIGGKGGIFKTEQFFKEVLNISEEKPDNAELAIVMDNDKLIGGCALFYWGDTVEYHTTCLRNEYRPMGPLNKIIVEKMLEYGMKGYRRWNFGGTWKSQTGVYNFKKSFGAKDHHYYYYTVFFRDLDRIRKMSSRDVLCDYPLRFVIPFSELENTDI